MRRVRVVVVGVVLGGLLLATGCSSEPTLADAEDYLHEGDPRAALSAARRAAERAETSEEQLRLRRFAFKASLESGASSEAAREYAHIRQLLGREDDQLLLELSTETFRLAGKSPDPARRLSALRHLARLTRLESLDRVRPLILGGLGDREPEVRCAALEAVARLPNPQVALDLLGPRAQSEPFAVVRQAAVRHLVRLIPALRQRATEHPEDRAWRPLLTTVAVRSSRDGDVEVRLAGLELLEALHALAPDPRVREALEAAVGNGDPVVARAAARILLRIDPARAVAAWRRAGAHKSSFGRALALGEDPSLRPQVLADLRSPIYARRLNAAQGLHGAAAARVARALEERVVSDPAVPVRAAALRALLSTPARGTPRLRAALRRVLRGARQPAARRLAFLTLERLKPHTTPALAELFAVGDPALVGDLAAILASKGDEASLAALRAGLPRDATRIAALEGLASRGGPATHDTLLPLLSDRDPRVRLLAARGLLRAGEPRDRALLVRTLEDPRINADLPAAAALLSIQDTLQGRGATSRGTRQ